MLVEARDVDPPGAKVIASNSPQTEVLGTELRSSARAVHIALNRRTPLQAPASFNHNDKTPEENDIREKKWLMISVYGGKQRIAD